jgi:hypothetical protein
MRERAHVGTITPGSIVAPALVPDARPADAHFAAASQLIHLASAMQGEHQRVTIESVQNEVALGLRAIAERRFTQYPMTARELESMRAL